MKAHGKLTYLKSSDYEKLFGLSIVKHERYKEQLAIQLHEELGADLMAVKMKIQTLDLCEKSKQGISADIKNILNRIRLISGALYPLSLAELGLVSALKVRLKELAKHEEMAVEMLIEDGVLIDESENVQSAIYYCLDEVLNFVSVDCSIQSLVLEINKSKEILVRFKENISKNLRMLNQNPLAFKLECVSARLKAIDTTIELSVNSNLFTQIKIDYKNAK